MPSDPVVGDEELVKFEGEAVESRDSLLFVLPVV
jgi:hypothetical protein